MVATLVVIDLGVLEIGRIKFYSLPLTCVVVLTTLARASVW